MTEKWYCVNNYGLAQLCRDRQNALDLAFGSDAMYPSSAPHRAVQLVDAADLEQAQDRAGQLEMALESLVERCNSDAGWCNEDSVIYAEALLERIYKARTA